MDGFRAVARILFQPRQRDEPGIGGGAPSGVQEHSPWSGGQGVKPLWSWKLFGS